MDFPSDKNDLVVMLRHLPIDLDLDKQQNQRMDDKKAAYLRKIE